MRIYHLICKAFLYNRMLQSTCSCALRAVLRLHTRSINNTPSWVDACDCDQKVSSNSVQSTPSHKRQSAPWRHTISTENKRTHHFHDYICVQQNNSTLQQNTAYHHLISSSRHQHRARMLGYFPTVLAGSMLGLSLCVNLKHAPVYD